MSTGRTQRENTQAAAAPMSRREWLAAWALRYRLPAATVVAAAMALLLTWYVIYGRHGVSEWRKARAQDRALKVEIELLTKENAEMARHVEQLKNDPDAIEREAREKLHYAKPGEVIYALPAQESAPPAAGAK